jgi:hypothetical protein
MVLQLESGSEQGLDGAPFVHCPVTFGGLLEREGQVEDLAGVDHAPPDELDQFGQEPPDRGWAAVPVYGGEEQLVAGQLDAVGDADVADVAAGTGGTDRLHHRLLGADGFDDRVRAEAAVSSFTAATPLPPRSATM